MAKRILIVDDSTFIRSLIRNALENQSGLEVCGEASDGVEAIAKARELKPDLIVLDLSMPRMNGLEAAEELKAIIPAVPKILFTLHKDSIPNALARWVGISVVMSKTDGIDPLIEEIQKLLGELHPIPA